MPKGDKPTVDEHFIPQMYFRGFSEIKESKPEKALIWQFNLNSLQQTTVPVDVRAICYKKHLYEIKSDDGSFIAQNTIEKTFGKIESQTSKVIHSIKNKSQNTNCLNCSTVLSEEDKAYLVIFINCLFFRDPETIEYGIKVLQKSNPEINTRMARNFTLFNLLPLGLDKEWNKNTIIRTALSNLSGMAFQIGIAEDDIIITSDRPAVIWPPKEEELYNRPRAVVFPLTSRLVLYLFPIEDVDPVARNCFTMLSKVQINDIYRSISGNARNWIYSRYPLTNEQIAIIAETRGRIHNGLEK